MLQNTQIATVETLETRTLMSASLFQVAAAHEQMNQMVTASQKHASQAATAAKAEKAAAHAAAIAAKKAAQQAAAAAKAAAAAAKKAAKHGIVTPTAPTTTPAGPTVLPDPTLTGSSFHYQAFASEPLFNAGGPSENDIAQGDLGDCYFLSTLSAVAKVDPGLIQNSITALGNGDFQVAFHRNGQTVDEVVDNKLAVDGNGNVAYAQLGQGSAMWVAIMEKAFCAFAGNNSYNSVSGGWMDTVFTALGLAPSDTLSAASGNALLASIASQLNAGEAVTIGINSPADGAALIGDHAYTVDSVGTDANGNPTLTVRNPWGFAGAGSNPNGSAYVTITAQQALDSMIGVVAAAV